MTKETAIKLFEQKQVRTLWDDDKETCFFLLSLLLRFLLKQTAHANIGVI